MDREYSVSRPEDAVEPKAKPESPLAPSAAKPGTDLSRQGIEVVSLLHNLCQSRGVKPVFEYDEVALGFFTVRLTLADWTTGVVGPPSSKKTVKIKACRLGLEKLENEKGPGAPGRAPASQTKKAADGEEDWVSVLNELQQHSPLYKPPIYTKLRLRGGIGMQLRLPMNDGSEQCFSGDTRSNPKPNKKLAKQAAAKEAVLWARNNEQEQREQKRLEQERVKQKRVEQQRVEQERVKQKRIEQQRVEQERVKQRRTEPKQVEQKRRYGEMDRAETQHGNDTQLAKKPRVAAERQNTWVAVLKEYQERKGGAPPVYEETSDGRNFAYRIRLMSIFGSWASSLPSRGHATREEALEAAAYGAALAHKAAGIDVTKVELDVRRGTDLDVPPHAPFGFTWTDPYPAPQSSHSGENIGVVVSQPGGVGAIRFPEDAKDTKKKKEDEERKNKEYRKQWARSMKNAEKAGYAGPLWESDDDEECQYGVSE